MTEEEKKEYIEHEIIDRLYCLEEKDFNKDTVTQDYVEAVIKAGKEAKELIHKQQKEIEELTEELQMHVDTNLMEEKLLKEIEQRQREIEELKELLNKYNDMQYIKKIEEKYISKAKIREKIKEIENSGLQENIKACVCNKLAQLL